MGADEQNWTGQNPLYLGKNEKPRPDLFHVYDNWNEISFVTLENIFVCNVALGLAIKLTL